jgi:2-C-methyl-D-erythritol 4-phosphate cytidylyltransferase
VTVLIVPAAGDSTRFEHLRPKFLLQHPMGKTMLAAGLEGIPDNIKFKKNICSMSIKRS